MCLYLAGLYSLIKCLHIRLEPTCKHYTRLERSIRDKHSSLFHLFVKYKGKNVYSIGPMRQLKKLE
jgi:hypothetical protein